VLCGCHLTRHNPNSVMGKLSSSIYFNIPTVTLNIEMNYSISKLIETKFANKTVCMLEILFYIKKLGFVWCSNFEAPFLTRARRTVLYYCMCCGVWCDVFTFFRPFDLSNLYRPCYNIQVFDYIWHLARVNCATVTSLWALVGGKQLR